MAENNRQHQNTPLLKRPTGEGKVLSQNDFVRDQKDEKGYPRD